MASTTSPLSETLPKDIAASIAVFLVALPLCLGIALASNAPLFSGILSGIIGGIVVGLLSGSDKSVGGPAAGLTATVASQIAILGSFENFLLAVLLAGVIQVAMGLFRLGFVAAFVPYSVIKGLLAAIGILLILKQLPHVLGHDADAEGEMSFAQPDHENTFSELGATLFDIHPGAALVGLLSIVMLVLWNRSRVLKSSPVPSALVVVLFGVGANLAMRYLGSPWTIQPAHLVQVPVAGDFSAFLGFLQYPAFSQWSNPAVYTAGITIAVVASLETLLNLDAVDKIDPDQKQTPPNRELIAQGIGNMTAGLIGGLPMTSVIVRSSVNINSGGRTKVSAILHGVFLLLCVVMVPLWLNEIPLAALAAILMVTGFKLASPELFKQMWEEGYSQFAPFILTIIAIVLTDLLTGIIIGLAIAVLFILHSNLQRPLRRIVERHTSGEVLRIELASQVSFLNRASLQRALFAVPRGGHVLLDARNTTYIDADIRDLITDFRDTTAAAHGVTLSLIGFGDHDHFDDHIQYVDFTSREVQSELTPQMVLGILREGNRRFRSGERIERDFGRQISATAYGQFPMAAVLSCIDSRAPVETIFDLGLGDIFTIRVAGNIAQTDQLGSMEYACVVAGSRLLVVMGHTSCGAVGAAIDLFGGGKSAAEATGCDNLNGLVSEIQESIPPGSCKPSAEWAPGEKESHANEVSRLNVVRTIRKIRERSPSLDRLVREKKLAIVGCLYNVATGEARFFQTPDSTVAKLELPTA